MKIELYKKFFNEYFNSSEFIRDYERAIRLIEKASRIFFIGNGGSNAICSHMAEDFMKIGGKPTFTFSDPALITCFSNDFGYENAMKEWIKFHIKEGDLLVAISSSGESKNITNCVEFVKSRSGKIITLSGFKQNNKLSTLGDINFHLNSTSYGIVECFHEIILHSILDEYAAKFIILKR